MIMHKPDPIVRATAAESAALLKKTLRAAFPATKFTVRLSRGTGYGCCSVGWVDGPTPQRVDAICADFEGEGFDGMTDSSYRKTAIMPDGRQSGIRLLNASRTLSVGFARRVAAAVSAWWGDLPVPTLYEKGTWWEIAEGMDRTAMARTGQRWSELIYRAAADRTTVSREPELS